LFKLADNVFALAPVRILRGCYPHGDKCGVSGRSELLKLISLAGCLNRNFLNKIVMKRWTELEEIATYIIVLIVCIGMIVGMFIFIKDILN
jgi:hypothetical protein